MKPRIALAVGLGWLICLSTPLLMAQEQKKQETIEPAYQTTATLYGGTSTGLFNTLGTRTLKQGEFTVGIFWNNYDRDPGDLDINQIPFNLAYGLTNRWEVFGHLDFYQQVTTRQPFALSGSQFNGIRSRFGGDPIVAFGRPIGGDDAAAAFFPGTGARAGGILPPPGAFFGPCFFDPTIGRAEFLKFASDRPSFYNDLPFFGPAAFDPKTGCLVRPDARESGNGLGNLTLGTKYNLISADRPISLAIAGIVRLPTARNYGALASGRGSGEVDYGPMVIVGQSFYDNRLRFSENVGYLRSGDPGKDGVKFLDRRNQLLLNGGVEYTPHQKVVLVGELNGTVYIGSGTPNLNPVNPWDLVLGFRYFASDGLFHLGAGYRRYLTKSNDRTIAGFVGQDPALRNFSIATGDVNGFVVTVGLGGRLERVPPPPPNRPPTVTLEADKTNVRDGEIVNLFARAADPDNDVLVYTWSKTGGDIVGSGPGVQLDTRGVNPTPGAPPVQVTATVMVDDGRGGTDSSSVTITVNAPPAPPPPPANRAPMIDSLTCDVAGTPQVPGQVTDGETMRITAVARDPDGDPLTYEWRSSVGTIRGTGPDVTLDTTGLTAGPGAPPTNITITLLVSDGRGGSDTESRICAVYAPKRPEAERLGPELEMPRGSARVNNVHKAILDDVALRLRQEPTAVLVIDGHADQGESAAVARQRAENAKNYLVREKGIDPGRIVVRSYRAERPHPSGERRRNPRVELFIVPAGAEIPR